jgi:hypothetical protein
MRKPLKEMEGGMAVVLDLPLLAIIGAEGAKELELTTDGSRLILTPIPGSRVQPSGPSDAMGRPPALREEPFDRDDPKRALPLIKELQEGYGFTPDHFRQIHHFGPKASLQTFVTYCQGTARFRSATNAVVNERLRECLRLRREARTWDEVLERVRSAFPFPK